MIHISKEDKEFIKANMENAEQVLASEEINDVLDALNHVINCKGFYGYEYNDFGREAQKVYDRLYFDNCV